MSRQHQIEVRKERTRRELPRYRITNNRSGEILSLYRVKSGSGYTYDVEIRNPFELENRCSCPDYESNGLGTCKHIEAVLIHLEREHPDEFRAQRARLAEEKAHKVVLQLAYEDETVIKASFDPALEKPVRKGAGHLPRFPQAPVGQGDPAFLGRIGDRHRRDQSQAAQAVRRGEHLYGSMRLLR